MLPNWQMNGLDVSEIPIDNPYGFIYKITYEDGTYYLGKKNFYSFDKAIDLWNNLKEK